MVVRQCDLVEGSNTINPVILSFSCFVLNKPDKSQEGEHAWLQLATYPPTKFKLRMLCYQEVEDDEDLTPTDMTIDYKVSSFQVNLSCGFENKLLPNNLIIVRNHGDDEDNVGEEFGGLVDQQGHPHRVGGPIQVELESVSESRSNMY